MIPGCDQRGRPETTDRVCVGIDGCRGGWYAVVQHPDGRLDAWVAARVAEVVAQVPPSALFAIDIPIGLPDAGARPCDGAARQRLGRTRGASVFPAPVRSVLAATTYAEACALHEAADGRRLSRQAYGLLAKIHEVDALLQDAADLRERVFEVHPELAFQALRGGPLAHSKKDPAGRAERLALLTEVFGASPAASVAARPRSHAAADDVLDAFAALWSARRLATGRHETLPPDAPRDRTGLRMAISY